MNEFKKLEEKHLNYDLKYFFISTIISTLLITVISNLNINSYIKELIFPILIILINYSINIYHNKLMIQKNGLYLFIPIGLIILNAFIFKVDSSNKFLNLLILPTLIIHFILISTNKKYDLKIRNFIIYLEEILSNLFSNLNKLNDIFKQKSKNKIFSKILIGLIIGIPISLIILSLLSGADSYFAYFIENIIDHILDLLNISFIWKNLFVISISFILTFSVFISLMLKNKEKEERKSINISSISVSVVLVLINLVFLLFLTAEISKLTTNFLKVPIQYTYSEYAREGFFQLLFITSINYIITMFIIYKTKLKDKKIIKFLLLVLIGFSIILIFNSYYRMFLYVKAYTFTILRLQVVLFLLLELIFFMLLIKKVISDIKRNNLKIYASLALSFYIVNLYLCNETIISFINKLIH